MESMKNKAEIAFGDSSSVPPPLNNSLPVMHNPLLVWRDIYLAPGKNITPGSFYEIAHVHLPDQIKIRLQFVRVAMVTEKNHKSVSIKFPSTKSLLQYYLFNTGPVSGSGRVTAYPEFDEIFKMKIDLAAKVLLKKVPFQEYGEKKKFHEFWRLSQDASKKNCCDVCHTINMMLSFGSTYLDHHSEQTDQSTSFEVARVELITEKVGESREKDEEQNEDEDEEENEVDEGEKEVEEDEDDGENEEEVGESEEEDEKVVKKETKLELLKEEILELKNYAKNAKKKQSELEEEVRKLRSEMKELKSKKKKGESQAIVVSSNPLRDEGLSQIANSSAWVILDHNKAPEDKNNEQQMNISDFVKELQMNISDFVKELQEKLSKLQSEVQERSKSNSALVMPSDSFNLKEKSQVGEVEQQHRKGMGSEVKTDNHEGDKAKAPEAEKAKSARIEKLRSGFRICKPQGTFPWPSMMNPASSSPSQQLHLQMEDLLLIPTPPSISLTPPTLPYQHHHAATPQLVKPLAECHRGFTVTAPSTVSESTTYDEDTATTNTTITTTTVMPHHFLGSANDGENC